MKTKIIKKMLDASYQNNPPSKIGGYQLDKDLTTPTAKVYYNPRKNEASVIHRGTQSNSLLDWRNNLAYLTGNYKRTDRYRQGLNTQNKAEDKYGKKNISTLGHSQGSIIAREVGADTKQIINVNPAYKFEIPKKNEYNIRSSSDVVSGLYAPVSAIRKSDKDITIPSKNPLDIIGEHSYNILDRLDNQQIGVREFRDSKGIR